MKYSTNGHILHATRFSFFGQFHFLECFGIFEWCNSNCCTLRIGRCGARMKARNIIRGRQKHVFVPKWLDGNEGQCLQTVWQWETSIVANYNCYLELLLLFLLCLVWEHRRGGGERPRLYRELLTELVKGGVPKKRVKTSGRTKPLLDKPPPLTEDFFKRTDFRFSKKDRV